MQILTENLKRWLNHVDVSENSGTYPKSSFLNRIIHYKHHKPSILGVLGTPIFGGNAHCVVPRLWYYDGLYNSNFPQGVRRHKPGSQSFEVEVSHSAAFTSEGSVRRCSKVEVPQSAKPQETFGLVGIWMFPKMVGFPNNHGFSY